jgi:Transposase and inactivated derivatives
MLDFNNIANLLDLEGVIITGFQKTERMIEIELEFPVKPHVCPKCGYVTSLIHDYRCQYVKDPPIQGKVLILKYRKRRYSCPSCNKHFAESQTLVPRYYRSTNRFAYHILEQLRKRRSISDIATDNFVSWYKVSSLLSLVEVPKPTKLPEVLSIDEFRGNSGGNKFQCILTDPVNKKTLDILPTRSQVDLIDYLKPFKNRDKVKFFVMDMNRVYLDLAKTFLPNAKIIIDRFHVARYNTWAFENVRKRVQKSLSPTQRVYFKHSRKLLLKRKNSLDSDNIDAINIMFRMAPELASAYLLKEKFYSFMDSPNSFIAKKRLSEFLMHSNLQNIPEYNPCVTMLNNWSEYILNSFDYRYSNSFTEGTNNKIKVIKRIAFGYRNFDNFRKRILFT